MQAALVLGVLAAVPAGLRAEKPLAGAKQQPGWELRAVLKGQEGSLAPLAFSPDGKTLAVTGAGEGGGAAAVLKLWDVSGAKPTLLRSLAGHKDAVVRLAFSRNGKGLVSVGADGVVKRWDVPTGKALGSFSILRRGDDAGPEGAWLSGTGQVLGVRRTQAFGGLSRPLPLEAEVWSVPAGKRQRLLRLPSGHLATALSPDGQTLLTVYTGTDLRARGSEVRLWNVATGRVARTCRTPEVIGALFAPTGKRVFLQCFNPVTQKPGLMFWDAGAAKPHFPRNPALTIGYAAACSADGKRLVMLSEDKHTVTVWALAGEKALTAFARLDNEVRGVALGAGGKLLAVADDAGNVRLWTQKAP
jgi:WD40 repeat protein